MYHNRLNVEADIRIWLLLNQMFKRCCCILFAKLLLQISVYIPGGYWSFAFFGRKFLTTNLVSVVPRAIDVIGFFFFFFLNKLINLFIYLFIYLFIHLFLAVLGLCFCTRAFSSCGERGPLFIAVHGPLTVAASPIVEHRLRTRRLSSCGSWAQLLRGMWDLPRPGLEPMSPALAGKFLTTAPPGKPYRFLLDQVLVVCVFQGVGSFNFSNLLACIS